MIDIENECERVAAFHADSLRMYGGSPGVRDAGCVHRSIGTAHNNAAYLDEGGANRLVEPAYVLVLLAKNHCFVDGNKRVAWFTFVSRLNRLRLDIACSEDEVVKFVERITQTERADPQELVTSVIEWLYPKLIAYEGALELPQENETTSASAPASEVAGEPLAD